MKKRQSSLFSSLLESLRVRHLVALVLMGLSLWGISLAARWGSAHLHYLTVEHHLERWSAQRQQSAQTTAPKIDSAELDEALSAAKTATERHPQHPHYWSTLAQVHEWRGYQQQTGLQSYHPDQAQAQAQDQDPDSGPEQNSALAREEFRLATAAYRKAMALRPLWPDVRIKLALNRWREGMVDEEFFELLRTADQTGPYTQNVNLGIAEAGLGLWTQLPKTSRRLTLEHLKRGMIDDSISHQVWQIARRHQKENILCLVIRSQLENTAPAQKYCQ